MPAFWGYPLLPHDYPYYWPVNIGSQVKRRQSQSYKFKNLPKLQIFEFWKKLHMWHTWGCLIRCVNKKLIRRVLQKIQRGHDSGHRRTDGQGETSIAPFNFLDNLKAQWWRSPGLAYIHNLKCTWSVNKNQHILTLTTKGTINMTMINSTFGSLIGHIMNRRTWKYIQIILKLSSNIFA